MPSDDSKKLELYGLLASDPDTNIRVLVQRMGVPFSRLEKWKKEYFQSKKNGELDKLINLDAVVADKIIEKSADEAVDEFYDAMELEIDPKTNEIVSAEELSAREFERSKKQQLKEAVTSDFQDGLAEVRDLCTKSEDAASKLIEVIADRLDEMADGQGDVSVGYDGNGKAIFGSRTKEIVELSVALSNIRNAYFNKPTTNIQVNQVGGGMLANFRNKLKA